MKFLRFFILWVLVMGLRPSVNAQSFILEYQNLDDSTLWFVKNNTGKPIKPTSFTLNWYHMKPFFVAWNNDPTQPFYNSTNKETNLGFNYTWRHKTTYGCSVGDTIQPGGRLQVAMTVNYNKDFSDTVMPANATLFVNNNVGFDEIEVIPAGSTCGFKRVYLNSYHKDQGISFYSTIWTPMTSGNCVNGMGLLMVPFNDFTLKQTPSSVFPPCSNGRLWTSYGYSVDSQLYYDGLDTAIYYWKSVVNGLDPGDYLAFASHVFVSKDFVTSLQPEFESLGVDVNGLLSRWTSNTAQLLILGRKGVAPGMAGMVFVDVAPNSSAKSVTGNFVMIKNQPKDELKPYPKCYESLSVIHKPYIPDTTRNAVKHLTLNLRISPNPVEDYCSVEVDGPCLGYELVDLEGKIVIQERFHTAVFRFDIPVDALSSGLYYLQVAHANGFSRISKVLMCRKSMSR